MLCSLSRTSWVFCNFSQHYNLTLTHLNAPDQEVTKASTFIELARLIDVKLIMISSNWLPFTSLIPIQGLRVYFVFYQECSHLPHISTLS